jgi:hypothetical protein
MAFVAACKGVLEVYSNPEEHVRYVSTCAHVSLRSTSCGNLAKRATFTPNDRGLDPSSSVYRKVMVSVAALRASSSLVLVDEDELLLVPSPTTHAM